MDNYRSISYNEVNRNEVAHVNQDFSNYHARLQERKQMLYGLIPSQGRILAAGLLDGLYMAGVAALTLFLYFRMSQFENTNQAGAIILVVLALGIAYELMILCTHGTFGMFVARIAYVHGDSGFRFNHGAYWEFVISSFFINLKFSGLYETYSFFTSPTNQSKSMQETGTYYVCIIAYNKLHKQRLIPFPRD